MLELGLAMSNEQTVIDDEFINMTKFACRGIDVNEKTLDLTDVKKVPPGGDYLTFNRTMEAIDMTSNPTLYDRMTRDDWIMRGGTDIVDRAHEKVVEYLAKPKPALPKNAVPTFDKIIAKYEAEIAARNN
jgi:trimethylamine:corrinoid methyltransferase-like protein